jgi:hypothetical protein
LDKADFTKLENRAGKMRIYDFVKQSDREKFGKHVGFPKEGSQK